MPDFTEDLQMMSVHQDKDALIKARNRMAEQGATWFQVTEMTDERAVRLEGWKVRPDA